MLRERERCVPRPLRYAALIFTDFVIWRSTPMLVW